MIRLLRYTLLGLTALTMAAWIVMPTCFAITWSTPRFIVVVADAAYVTVDPVALQSETYFPAGIHFPTNVYVSRSFWSGLHVGRWRGASYSQIFAAELFITFVLCIGPMVEFGRRLRRARLARAGRCTSCGYDLRGNTSGTCSECGASFDAIQSADGRNSGEFAN